MARTFKSICSSILSKLTIARSAIQKRYDRVLYYIDPNGNSTPQASTVFWSNIIFVTFLIFGGLAIGYPYKCMRIVVLTFNLFVFIALATMMLRDFLSHRRLSNLISTTQ